MTAYRAGQRVRIEWPNGSAVEGTVSAEYDDTLEVGPSGGGNFPALYDLAFPRNRTITVLSEPRPDEPTGLGAVVRAGIRGGGSRLWVHTFNGGWATDEPIVALEWDDLTDPVVLSEGWTP